MKPILLGALCALLLPLSAQGQPKAQAADEKPAAVIVDQVIAVVNNTVVLDSELRMRVAPMVADLSEIEDLRERKRRRTKIVAQLLDEMIHDELMIQAANEAKLEVAGKEIQNALEEIKKQNKLDDEGLKRFLEPLLFVRVDNSGFGGLSHYITLNRPRDG